MKLKSIVINALLLLSIGLNAQTFAPVGAEWFYTERFAMSGDIDYIHIESVKDTVINGKSCNKVDLEQLCMYHSGVKYLHINNDTVYSYDFTFQKFQVLYIFNVVKGDSWKILLNDNDIIDTVVVSVDSVLTIDINGHNLKELYVTYNLIDVSSGSTTVLSYNSVINEKMGDLEFLFNFPEHVIDFQVCDESYSSGIRCYADSNFGNFSTREYDSCDQIIKWTEIDDLNYDDSFITISPNPGDGSKVRIAINKSGTKDLQILDSKGSINKHCSFDGNEIFIDCSEMKSGIYSVSIRIDERNYTKKLIIK